MDELALEPQPPLGDEEMQLLHQVTSSLCKEALILLALGPTGSGKTITLNRLTAGLVQLDVGKRRGHTDPFIRPDIHDLFDGRHPTCYVREFDFSSLPPKRMEGIAPLDTPLKLAVIDSPGFSNKIQLNEDIICNGLKSLDSFLTTCKLSLNSPKAHVFVVYFLKQTWTWSKTDARIMKAIQQYYGSVNVFCVTHSLVVPAFIQHPLPEELSHFKGLDLPDINALREEEDSYLELVGDADKLAAQQGFEKSWISLYKRLFSLSSHVTNMKGYMRDARIIFFENSPNLSSSGSDLGLANLVFKFSRSLNYNYGSFFTILTSADILVSACQYLLLPTCMDRSRVSRLSVEKEEAALSPFHKYDIDCVRKGQMDFFEECREVIEEISRDKIHRISRSFFKSSLPCVSEEESKPALQKPDSPHRFVSQESSRSCSSTLSDTDISSSSSGSATDSESSRRVKMKLLSIKALWSDLFESREEGFQFLREETKNIPQSSQPNQKYPRVTASRDKSGRADGNSMSRRKSAPLFSSLALFNPDLAQLLSKKRASETAHVSSPFHSPDSSSNNIRLKKSHSESPVSERVPPLPSLSKSQVTRPRAASHRIPSANQDSFSSQKKPARVPAAELSPPQHALSRDLEETIVNLIGEERKRCLLCKDAAIYSICPKCKRGYCEACVLTFSGFQRICKFDSSVMESASL